MFLELVDSTQWTRELDATLLEVSSFCARQMRTVQGTEMVCYFVWGSLSQFFGLQQETFLANKFDIR